MTYNRGKLIGDPVPLIAHLVPTAGSAIVRVMLNPTVLPRRAPARLALLLFALVLSTLSVAHAQTYSQIIVFGDSLSDTGNDADVSEDKFGVRVPGFALGGQINYTDGRFTSGKDTDPASTLHGGIWHEQLAKLFLGLPAATASLDGGLDFAYGGATTEDGTRELDFTSQLGITVNNMGQQINDYLAKNVVDPAALYIVWGGANDIFVSDRDAAALLKTGKKAARREAALISRLAEAGAVNFLVPNLPPIGNTPRYNASAGATAAYNAASEIFGRKLAGKLTALNADLTARGINVNIKMLDVYGIFQRLLANQQAYNFYNIAQSSQGESVKADNYLFWDDVHPTASGHYQLAVEAYTVLTGRPLVQIAPDFTADGFWLTRSGTDLDKKLVVPYAVGGSAVAGVDYATLAGSRKIQPGNYTRKIKTPAIDGQNANGKDVVLGIADGGDEFGVGTVVTARIEYGNPIANVEEPAIRNEFAKRHPLIVPTRNGQ